MTKQTFSSLGLDVTVQVPSTVDEFDKLAAKPGACLEQAIQNIVYRGVLADFRVIFLHGQDEKKDAAGVVTQVPVKGLDDITGITRKEVPVLVDGKPKMDGTTPITMWDPEDSEAKFFKRVCAQKGWTTPELVASNVAKHLADVCAVLVFDPKASERKATGPKKLPEIYKVTATNILTKDPTGAKVIAKIAAESKTVVTLEPVPKLHAKSSDADKAAHAAVLAKNVDLLGWGIKANEDFKRPKALESAYSV